MKIRLRESLVMAALLTTVALGACERQDVTGHYDPRVDGFVEPPMVEARPGILDARPAGRAVAPLRGGATAAPVRGGTLPETGTLPEAPTQAVPPPAPPIIE